VATILRSFEEGASALITWTLDFVKRIRRGVRKEEVWEKINTKREVTHSRQGRSRRTQGSSE